MAGLFDQAYAKISNALMGSGKYTPTGGTRNQVGYSSTAVPVPDSVKAARAKMVGNANYGPNGKLLPGRFDEDKDAWKQPGFKPPPDTRMNKLVSQTLAKKMLQK
jgi:hypothetical protein